MGHLQSTDAKLPIYLFNLYKSPQNRGLEQSMTRASQPHVFTQGSLAASTQYVHFEREQRLWGLVFRNELPVSYPHPEVQQMLNCHYTNTMQVMHQWLVGPPII